MTLQTDLETAAVQAGALENEVVTLQNELSVALTNNTALQSQLSALQAQFDAYKAAHPPTGGPVDPPPVDPPPVTETSAFLRGTKFGSASPVTISGKTYSADTLTGGWVDTLSTLTGLYATGRILTATTDISLGTLQPGTYDLLEYYSESWFGLEGRPGPNQRKFARALNGVVLQASLDIFVEANGAQKPLAKSSRFTLATAGEVKLKLTKITDNPVIRALEIVKVTNPATTGVAINPFDDGVVVPPVVVPLPPTTPVDTVPPAGVISSVSVPINANLDLPNLNRGSFGWLTEASVTDGWARPNPDGLGFRYRRCLLYEFNPQENLYDFDNAFKPMMDRARQVGGTAGFRLCFHYNDAAIPQWVKNKAGWTWTANSDYGLQRYLNFNNPEVLAYLQRLFDAFFAWCRKPENYPYIGMIDIAGWGQWGEWHMGGIPNHGAIPAANQANYDNLKKIVDMQLDGGPEFHWLMLRGTTEPVISAIFKYTHSKPRNTGGYLVGLRNDGAGTTLVPNMFNDQYIKDSGWPDAWKARPFVLEGYGGHVDQHGQKEGQQVVDHHGAALANANRQDNDTAQEKADTLAAGKKAGFRLGVDQVIRTNQGLHVRWLNKGAAPTYDPYVVTYTIDGVPLAPSAFDLRGVLPGAPAYDLIPIGLSSVASLKAVVKPSGRFSSLKPMQLMNTSRAADGSYVLL